MKSELTDVERKNWSEFIKSISPDVAGSLLKARGYRSISEIDPAARASVMRGMACDVRDGFRHNKPSARSA